MHIYIHTCVHIYVFEDLAAENKDHKKEERETSLKGKVTEY